MNQIQFRLMVVTLGLINIGVYAQNQSKTYKERFVVSDNTVLDIDTSHADISFETWNKDEILIEATIELEGVSDEEAEAYFENAAIEIVGNSKKVTVKTHSENTWSFNQNFGSGLNDFDFHFESPEVFDIYSSDTLYFDFPELAVLPELMEMPPMPPMPEQNFDYKAFKKDGKKYLEKWQKEFSKGFNKDYEKKMKEWGERMEARREKSLERQEQMLERRQESQERLLERREKQQQKREVARVKRMEASVAQKKLRAQQRVQRDSIRYLFIHDDDSDHEPNIFYFSSGDENKNYKVKKTIRVKLPKSIKIKMNVRHGEVKLAENTKNLNATLSYASLWASTIDGEATNIRASYTPVSVQKWNYGQLQTNYSEKVNLKEVLNLRLSATSSDVVIDQLQKSAFIKNDFGPLYINSISKDFKELDVSLKNAEINFEIPSTPFTIYVKGVSSEFSAPDNLNLERTKNLNSSIQKGYYINRNSNRSVIINSEYSKVVLEN